MVGYGSDGSEEGATNGEGEKLPFSLWKSRAGVVRCEER